VANSDSWEIRVGDIVQVLPGHGFLGLVDYEPLMVLDICVKSYDLKTRAILLNSRFNETGYFISRRSVKKVVDASAT